MLRCRACKKFHYGMPGGFTCRGGYGRERAEDLTKLPNVAACKELAELPPEVDAQIAEFVTEAADTLKNDAVDRFERTQLSRLLVRRSRDGKMTHGEVLTLLPAFSRRTPRPSRRTVVQDAVYDVEAFI